MSGLAAWYPWVKTLHILAIVAWMAGLLYLPRLFVYHAAEAPESPMAATFLAMERRLLRGIMNPAMVAVLVSGAALALTPGVVAWSSGWIYVKLTAATLLVIFHHALARWRKDFATGQNRRPARFYRLVNELPTLFLIVIVIMVVVKPF